MNIYKKNMGPYKLQQPPHRWSRSHEPTSIMANVQQKVILTRFGPKAILAKFGPFDSFCNWCRLK